MTMTEIFEGMTDAVVSLAECNKALYEIAAQHAPEEVLEQYVCNEVGYEEKG